MSNETDDDRCLREIEDMIDNDSFIILDDLEKNIKEEMTGYTLNDTYHEDTNLILPEAVVFTRMNEIRLSGLTQQKQNENMVSKMQRHAEESVNINTANKDFRGKEKDIKQDLYQNASKSRIKFNKSHLALIDTYELTNEQISISNVGDPPNFFEKPLFMIKIKTELIRLILELKQANEFAIDVQFHKHNYRPVLSLMTIATRTADHIIDTIELKSELSLLREIFIHPKIVKIIYDASRNLPLLYHMKLVFNNIFDVANAATIVFCKKPLNISYLIKDLYSLERGKSLFDYQQRPIQDKIKTYVRTNAHYMYYMYHNFKSKMLRDNRDQYFEMVGHCRQLCKKEYTKTEEVVLDCMQKFLNKVQNCQSEILKKLHDWREALSKKWNKTPNYILPQASLMKLSIQMPLKEKTVLSIIGGNHPHARHNVCIIMNIIDESRKKHKILRHNNFESNIARTLNETKCIQKRNNNNRTTSRKRNISESSVDQNSNNKNLIPSKRPVRSQPSKRPTRSQKDIPPLFPKNYSTNKNVEIGNLQSLENLIKQQLSSNSFDQSLTNSAQPVNNTVGHLLESSFLQGSLDNTCQEAPNFSTTPINMNISNLLSHILQQNISAPFNNTFQKSDKNVAHNSGICVPPFVVNNKVHISANERSFIHSNYDRKPRDNINRAVDNNRSMGYSSFKRSSTTQNETRYSTDYKRDRDRTASTRRNSSHYSSRNIACTRR